jgi:excisionase family DNA binding protein
MRDQHAPRLALTPTEAAARLGVGRSFFYEHVLPELRTVRRGRKNLIPLTELDKWLRDNSAR